MSPTVGSSPMYVVLGASGNTGSISADFLLTRGSKVRVVGRDAGRLRRFVRCGCAQESLERGARGVLDAAADILAEGAGATERCDRESGERVGPGLRGPLEKPWGPSSRRHRAGHGTAFRRAKTERDQRFERSAPAPRVFHGEQPGGDRHDPGDGNIRTCVAARPEAAHDCDAGHWRLCRAATSRPGFFRQANLRAAWPARPVDCGSYRADCAWHWQTGSALRAASV